MTRLKAFNEDTALLRGAAAEPHHCHRCIIAELIPADSKSEVNVLRL